jgi:hypothetical protein
MPLVGHGCAVALVHYVESSGIFRTASVLRRQKEHPLMNPTIPPRSVTVRPAFLYSVNILFTRTLVVLAIGQTSVGTAPRADWCR